jgi:hypothetical protein
MVAEVLRRRPAPKARAKGALENFGLFGRQREAFFKEEFTAPAGTFGALP